MPSHVINDYTLKITDVIPITIRAVRNYPAWVIVKIRTDQGVEGIGEGFTWAGQAGFIADYILLMIVDSLWLYPIMGLVGIAIIYWFS